MIKLILIIFFLSSCLSQTLLPNSNYMAAGFDPRIGQPTLDALRGQVFEFNESNNTIDIQGNTYFSPEDLQIINWPTESSVSVTQVYTSSYNLQQSLSKSYSSSYNSWFTPGMYSYSATNTFFQESKEESASYTASTDLVYTVYKATREKFNLTKEFEQALNNLPNEFNNETCKEFYAFFSSFGTHYVLTGIFGGSLSSKTIFSENLLQNYTLEEITQQINQQFLFWSESDDLDYYQETEYSQLNAYYDTEFELIGGYAYMFNASDYGTWEATIINDPILVSILLVGFSKLLNPSETNKINALEAATKAYFYDYYLKYGVINDAPPDLFYYWPQNYAMVNEKMYFMSGENNYMYDPVNNLWSVLERGPLAGLAYYTCSAGGNNIYCFGGYFLNDYGNEAYAVNIYDTLSNSWVSLNPDIYYCDEHEWPTNSYIYCKLLDSDEYKQDYKYFYGGVATTLDNYIYILGTLVNNGDPKNTSCVEPTGTAFMFDIVNQILYQGPLANYDMSTQIISSPGMNYQGSIVVGNAMYLLAPVICPEEMYKYCDCPRDGYTTSVVLFSPCVEAYDEEGMYCWYALIEKSPMPELLINFSLISDDNYVYVIGGYNPDMLTFNNNIYKYDTFADEWTTIISKTLNTAAMSISFVLNDFVFYFSGSDTVNGFPYLENTVQITSLIEPCV